MWKPILLLFLITRISFYVVSSRFDGSTECDFVRSSYIELEQSLWEKYVDKESSLPRQDRLNKIFNQHFTFIEQYIEKDFNAEAFKVLAKFYEWNIIEPDVKSIHDLFKNSFLHRLELELESNEINGVGFDKRAALDLAETVLTDPLWPINATIEKIQTNIYNQGLYYKAKSVRTTHIFNAKIQKCL